MNLTALAFETMAVFEDCLKNRGLLEVQLDQMGLGAYTVMVCDPKNLHYLLVGIQSVWDTREELIMLRVVYKGEVIHIETEVPSEMMMLVLTDPRNFVARFLLPGLEAMVNILESRVKSEKEK